MPLLTARELAAELQLHESEIYRKAAAGEIPSYKFGKSRRFDLAQVLGASVDAPVRADRAGPVRRLRVKRTDSDRAKSGGAA